MLQKILKGLIRHNVLGCKRKVDFLVAGTQKGGTTALDAYLREHPDIGMADRKEVHFFSNEKNFRNGEPPYSIYHSHFAGVLSRPLLGEATPLYMYWHDAPRRIWQYNPGMKLIMVLRNPIERAYSAWNMERDRKAEALTFWDALQHERERREKALPGQDAVYSYVDKGFYAEQLERIWACFPKDQTLVIKSEDLRKNPLQTLNTVCGFLKVPSFERVENKEAHVRQYLTPIGRREREFLKKTFAPDIKKLEQLLGWDCASWLAG